MADFGLFLGFVAEAFGEELVHEGLFQFGGGLNDPLLRFGRRHPVALEQPGSARS